MTQPKPVPSLAYLNDTFEYDPYTGILSRKLGFKGSLKPIKYNSGRGWIRVRIKGKNYGVHRIAWKMFYGEDPPLHLQIDHINRVRSDNRISNLRVVTPQENVKNSERVLNPKVRRKSPRKSDEELAIIRIENGRKTRKPIILITPNGEEIEYESVKQASLAHNLSNLSSVLTGKIKNTKGFTARYAD
jgi:hypothetical protein